jgi:hypothetical protein
MVESTAIPSAIAAIRLVPRFSRMPRYPIIPKKMTIGSTFGRMAKKPIFTDRNIAAMMRKMMPSARVRLSICPLTMSEVVPVRRTSVPVSRTGMSAGKCFAR